MTEENNAPRWKQNAFRPGRFLLGVLLVLLPVLTLSLVLLFVPAQVAAAPRTAPEVQERFFQQTNNLLEQNLEGYTYIHKHFRISAGALPSRPLDSGFGATDDPEEVLAVIEGASDLLGEEVIVGWTPETVLRPGSLVRYYYDETILVLTWQELSGDRVCTWCEVKLADPSQLRRKLAGDQYGSPVQMPATMLAWQDNAVAAVSGDFYAHRTDGVHVNDGLISLVSGWYADTCFFNRDGDMLFVHRNEITNWTQADNYVRENDILFSVAFGPVLVENGQINIPWDYPWGELRETYSRAVLSQVGHLHYLFLAGNSGSNGYYRFTGREAAQLMIDHGCVMAYNMDGGQTAEVILGGQLMNVPEFHMERPVSDVLCFASALPEGGAA
ncbi:MAG: phosphodiester glycosidase family protein [Oscillospiraceae bacterium]|nr:phosphodiester glycosidase family protein [Oscillospiraceae bacterium]